MHTADTGNLTALGMRATILDDWMFFFRAEGIPDKNSQLIAGTPDCDWGPFRLFVASGYRHEDNIYSVAIRDSRQNGPPKIALIRKLAMRMRKLKQVTGFVIAVVLGTCIVVAFLRVSVFSQIPHASEAKSDSGKLADLGAALFKQNCQGCHFFDRTDVKVGPGLKDLFKRDRLPASGSQPTEANVIKQLRSPMKEMPSFAQWPEDQINHIVAYLKTL